MMDSQDGALDVGLETTGLLAASVADPQMQVDLTGLYLRDVGRYPLLSPAAELALARAARQGDPDAEERLALCNLRLVVYAAREYTLRGHLTLLDLIQEGNIGLLQAVKKFDPERGFRFSTYALWWIHHAMRRSLAEEGRTVRLPLSVLQLAQRIEAYEQSYLDAQGNAPSTEQVAQALEVSAERVLQVRAALQGSISLEESPDEDGKDVNELLADEKVTSPESEAFRQLWWEALERELPRLSPRQHEVFSLRYGLHDGVAHTLASIGQRLGISRERARQLEEQALDKLRRSASLQQLAQWFRAQA